MEEYKSILRELQKTRNLLFVSYPLTIFYIGIILRKSTRSRLDLLTGRRRELEAILIQSSKSTTLEALDVLSAVHREDTYLTSQRLDRALSILRNRETALRYLYSIKAVFAEPLNASVSDALVIVQRVFRELEEHNSVFIERRKKQYRELWQKSPAKLDDNQLTAIVKDDKHNLVVAGAGSGKTEVLVTRIAYLLERKPDGVKPERILAIAYQNKAASDIQARLGQRSQADVKVKTFHKLGLDILKVNAEQKKIAPPQIAFSSDNSDKAHQLFVRQIYDKLLENQDFRKDVVRFMWSYPDDTLQKEERDFSSKEEYYAYMRQLRYVALDGTRVKSLAERDIFNFFIMHELDGQRIDVQYASAAEWMRTMNSLNRDPHLDFYFPAFNLYLEHWALDKVGHVPAWFGQPADHYRHGMKQKKKAFAKQNHFRLIETYSWEYYEDDFLKKVGQRFLEAVGPDNKLNPLSYDKLVNRIWWECRKQVESLPSNISRFIVIAKTYNLTPEKVRKRLASNRWTSKQKAFGRLAVRVFEVYEQALRRSNKIDFEDMINQAVKVLDDNPDFLQDTYDQILVDEYQDISQQRYELLRALMSKNPRCKLFCVGDDWQSIMGFSGTNMDLFVRFEDYFDHPARTDLTNNYRSTKSIVETGSKIIAQNGRSQLQKQTLATNPTIDRVKVYGVEGFRKSEYHDKMVRHCIDTIIDYLKKGYRDQELMVLYRARNFTLLNKLNRYAGEKGLAFMHGGARRGVPLLTVHKSKGLEARVVFILDVVRGLYGFPCEIQNPDVWEPAKLQANHDREEEERRLFYVAMTRAKEKVYIYTQNKKESKFLEEIKNLTEQIPL